MSKVIIVGAGGVGKVVAHKCAQAEDIFTDILLASRTVAKCDAIATEIAQHAWVESCAPVPSTPIMSRRSPRCSRRKSRTCSMNVALPYQDLSLMDACLAAGVDYMDTANYEPPDTPKFEYKWQWAYRERYDKAGRMALLGSGFDPGRDKCLLRLRPEAPL